MNKPCFNASRNKQQSELYRVSISNRIDEFADRWDTLSAHLLLKSDHLAAIEQTPPAGMDFLYVLVEDQEQVIAKSAFQILHFNAAKSLYLKHEQNKQQFSFFRLLGKSIKETVAKSIDFFTLIQGNLMQTGSYHSAFHPALDSAQKMKLRSDIQHAAREKASAMFDNEIPVFLIKEYPENDRLPTSFLTQEQLHEFTIQPNMVLNPASEWNTFEDYLQALLSKYRIRAGRAARKLKGVQIETLQLSDLQNNRDILYDLYLQIANQAGFNMVSLNPDYFIQLKATLGEQFQVKVFRKDEEIIGFFTYFLFEEELLAHFVGFDQKMNLRHQLYLNMLYQLIQTGIEKSKKTINLGRTASEIKSSVGAIPEEMYCYIRHSNRLYNKMVPTLLKYLTPEEQWIQRHPFKLQK